MISHNYNNYGLASVSSKPSLPSLPPLPPYTSPYTGHTRYPGSGSGKYDHISPYSTPNNYSRLSRGSSLQDVGPPRSPQAGRRLWRQSSLETEGRRGEGQLDLHHHQLDLHHHHHQQRQQHHHQQHQQHHQLEHRRRERRLGLESGSGRGERAEKKRPIDCNKICTGIIIGNGETVCDLTYLKTAGVTHVLNTAEHHVSVSHANYVAHGIQYYGFHVDDLPHCNISRYFHRTTDFIDRAVTGGGLVVVNCYMGLSRSTSVVIAYLMTKHNMSLDRALDFVKKSRNVRPNEGFLRQLRDLEFSLKRRR